MFARSRAANRLGLLLSAALVAACAHVGRSRAGAAAVYENARGERIVISPGTIAIGGAVYPLADCSDADHFCATSEIGFRISFPRRCPDFAWLPEGGPMQQVSIWPHGGGAQYVTRGSSHFIYDWQNRYGLVMINYDPRTDFAVRPTPPWRSDGPSVYQHKSGPRLFACR